MDDHDLLVCIDVKLRELKEQFKNHLKHHFIVSMAACGVALSTVTTLAIYILTH